MSGELAPDILLFVCCRTFVSVPQNVVLVCGYTNAEALKHNVHAPFELEFAIQTP